MMPTAEELAWLNSNVPLFFPDARFEVEPLPDGMVIVRVFGSMGAAEFRKRRYDLCEAMLGAGYCYLYEIVSVFQKSVPLAGV